MTCANEAKADASRAGARTGARLGAAEPIAEVAWTVGEACGRAAIERWAGAATSGGAARPRGLPPTEIAPVDLEAGGGGACVAIPERADCARACTARAATSTLRPAAATRPPPTAADDLIAGAACAADLAIELTRRTSDDVATDPVPATLRSVAATRAAAVDGFVSLEAVGAGGVPTAFTAGALLAGVARPAADGAVVVETTVASALVEPVSTGSAAAGAEVAAVRIDGDVPVAVVGTADCRVGATGVVALSGSAWATSAKAPTATSASAQASARPMPVGLGDDPSDRADCPVTRTVGIAPAIAQ